MGETRGGASNENISEVHGRSRTWKRSSVCRTLRGFDHIVLIADQGYGIEKCLMTPHYNPVTPQKRAFNDLLQRERVIIERCFGQLKQRFPISQGTVRVRLNFVPTLIVAFVILHNIAKYFKDELVFGEEDHPDESEENIFNVHNGVSSNAMRIADQQKQQQIIHNLG
ncbi:hypothetical protein JTB14_012256 [Gonioctena quinquepunctata]|nr:hypothetical protein JTB14_012256 [Gonioctena quinquepunctata]